VLRGPSKKTNALRPGWRIGVPTYETDESFDGLLKFLRENKAIVDEVSLVRYYGWHSNKSRGLRAKAARANGTGGVVMQQDQNKTNLFGFGYGDGSRWYQAGLVQLAAHEWQHVAVVCGDGKSVCYVNGVEKSSGAGSGALAPNPNLTFRLGQGYGEKRFFRGLLSDMRIYRGALTAAEVQKVMKE